METEETITSLKNALVKRVLHLKEKSRERKKEGAFIVEGLREIKLAEKGNYTFEKILICPTIFDINLSDEVPNAVNGQVLVSTIVYEKLAHRQTTEGIMAIVKSKDHDLAKLKFKTANPLILVAEAPEKPGNIGALLRTADAANLDAVLIANPKSDVYNPNIIRSSVGCVFTNTIGVGTTEEIIAFLQQHNIAIHCAALTASKNYVEVDYTSATAIVVGTEATGLSKTWLNNAKQNIIIPMQGEIDSMNVSVSAAILIFEAKRQRGF